MSRAQPYDPSKNTGPVPGDDVDRRLREAFPEINFEAMGERLKLLGGSHNLEEKWGAMVREFQSFLDLSKVAQ